MSSKVLINMNTPKLVMACLSSLKVTGGHRAPLSTAKICRARRDSFRPGRTRAKSVTRSPRWKRGTYTCCVLEKVLRRRKRAS
jgi:hypothetical protein